MHFKHILAKIQVKNVKQHFDWKGRSLWGSGGLTADVIYGRPLNHYLFLAC